MLPPDEREARIKDLTNDEARRPVLVATDCLSEGVNLQGSFQAVVHYDLAWNPTRHEQREGRVDRFGQRASTVRAVTLYGTDNGIDGIVLDVLLRKHIQIRKALGISVPVPDRSDDVVQAILEGLLLRDAPGEQLAFEGIGLEKRTGLHREWDSAAARERQSRTKYAQAGIQPAEVARELAEMRASLGTPGEVDAFTAEALSALHADVTPVQNGFQVATAALPAGLRDALVTGHAEPLPFLRDLPCRPAPPTWTAPTRTSPRSPGTCWSRRSIRVDAADAAPGPPVRRDAHLGGDNGGPRCCWSGSACTWSCPAATTGARSSPRTRRCSPTGARADEAEWLSAAEVQALLAAQPSGNVPPDQAIDFAERAVADLPTLRPHLDGTADVLASAAARRPYPRPRGRRPARPAPDRRPRAETRRRPRRVCLPARSGR